MNLEELIVDITKNEESASAIKIISDEDAGYELAVCFFKASFKILTGCMASRPVPSII